MRIIPSDILPYSIKMSANNKVSNLYFEESTIDITEEEWDEIGEKYYYHKDDYERNHITKHRTFSQYLRELLELKEGK